MLHNIEPHEYNCDFLPRPPILNRDYLLFFSGEQILLKQKNGGLVLPHLCDIVGVEWQQLGLRYLFAIDSQAFFCTNTLLGVDELIESENCPWQYMPLSDLREFNPPWLAFAAITGHHLHFWYAHNRYCGACGAELKHSDSERALLCPRCGYLKYPEIALAVIVGVCNGDKLLLTKYAGRSYKRFALIAGFVEIGEALEDSVRREVYEEVGIHVKNLRYFASQPWGFSHSLLAGFFAETDGSVEITLDKRELAEAVWVQRKDICADPSNISLTATMMTAFKEGKT
jgi:NAD+ diphosphatase